MSAVWLLCLSAAASSVEWELVGQGHEAHPALPALLRAAGEAAEESLARIREELGLVPAKAPILWVLDVTDVARPARQGEPFKLGRTRFVNGSAVLSIPARKYLREPPSVRSVIAHEAVHAALMSALGSPELYEAVPAWFREGMAVHFAGEGDLLVREAVVASLLEDQPADAFLTGLPPMDFARGTAPRGGRGAEVSYAEAYLASSYIHETLGASGWKVLVSRAASGQSLVPLLESLLGSTREALRAGALRHARQRVGDLLPAALGERFRESIRADKRGEGEGARAAWERILEEDSSGPLASTVRYFLARSALKELGSPAARLAARRHLEGLLSERGSLWRPEGLVLLGECLESEGDTPRAREAWLEVLEVFGEDSGPAARAREALAAAGTGSTK
ncbi:MAG TPA: hypothetical protein VMT52_15515 [Planctomycetota bacterium]|nr:hypothetical protein [Planctomycetota bacterium]